jgi:cystathionine beta-lyase
MYDFETQIDRVPYNSIKWSYPGLCLPGTAAEDLPLPLWVADMDFASPPEVVAAVKDRAGHPIYGYAGKPDAFFEAFASWMRRRHGLAVERQWLHFTPGIVTGLALAVNAFTAPGDGIIIQPPVYHPFRHMIERNGRRMVENPLLYENGRWTMDLDGLERIAGAAKAIILCSPHNPAGRVWEADEIERLVGICARRGIFLISDEIHSDIVYGGRRHVSALSAAQDLGGRFAAFFAPSKTFNIAGLQTSYAVIPDAGAGRLFETEAERLGLGNPNVFGATAAQAAYEKGEPWLAELLACLEGNAAFLRTQISLRFPSITMVEPEGTYLAWIDFRRLGIEGSVQETLARKAKIWLDDGAKFGTGGRGWARLNFGCPRANLELALDRLEEAMPGILGR